MPDDLVERLDEIIKCADSVVFHQVACMGGCHASMYELARLAKLIGYKADPHTQEEFDAALAAGHDNAEPHEAIGDNLRDRIAALTALVAAKDAALQKSYLQFQWYADEHTKAGKLDKAKTNYGMANICTEALALTPADMAGKVVADKEILKSTLAVLCAAKDGQSWNGNMLKDICWAIRGIRAMLDEHRTLNSASEGTA